MQTGQNSIAPENSLPQLGHLRWGSVLIDLTDLQMGFKVSQSAWISSYEFFVSSSFKAASAVDRIQGVVLERGKQKRANTGVGRGKEIGRINIRTTHTKTAKRTDGFSR